MADDGEAAEIERLRAEVDSLRADNDALRVRCAELIGAEMALRHMLLEARATHGERRSLSRAQMRLLTRLSLGSA